MKFTILGASGYIGGALRTHLESKGHTVFCPGRGSESIFREPLGHVVYCIGLTADFRSKPSETVDAHVSYLNQVLRESHFDSLLYLSTTRVYLGAETGRESADLRVNPGQPDDLYNLTKLTGEAICRAFAQKNVRVARLSNVLGGLAASPNFVSALIDEINSEGRVALRTTLDSAKDYVALSDVVHLLELIALNGKHLCYNVASGQNLSNALLLERLGQIRPFEVSVVDNATRIVFPSIDIGRVASEFAFMAKDPLVELVGKLLPASTV